MTASAPDRPDPGGFSFASLACEVSHPGGRPAGCRFSGHDHDQRRLVLDFAGASIEPRPPARLDAVHVVPDPADATRWQVESAQGRFTLRGARLYVHEDVAARAAAAIPPRPVPLAKRAFWWLVFALLATPFGRRWLERRASRSN